MAGSSFAQTIVPRVCSNKMIKGTYAYTCTGTVSVSPSVSVPAALIGVVYSDGKGHFQGPATADFNGQFMSEYLSTTGPDAQPAIVNPNCTGTITYEMYTSDPNTQDSSVIGPLPIKFVIAENGNEIRGLPTAPGYIVTCQLIRVQKTE
jgi:hypothetical protein